MIAEAIAGLFGGRLSGTANPDRWFVDALGGGMTSSGERINETTALSFAAVKAAVTVLAETIATMPFGVFQRLPNGGVRPAPEHPVHVLIHDEPNKETSSYNWRETIQGHLGTWGNGYAEIERARDGRTPLALWQRSPKPSRTKPFRDDSGQIKYELRDGKGGLEDIADAENMLHVPGFGFDGLIGYSPIRLLREAIGGGKGAERYGNEVFKNDGAQRGVLTIPGELSEEAYARAKLEFNDDRSQHGQRHRMLLLEGGASFAATQMDPASVQMIETRRFSIEEFARAYRITPHLLGDLTHGTFSNVVELGKEFIMYTMASWMVRWEQEVNRKLLGDGFFAKFNARKFLQADHTARSNFYLKMFRIGALSVNDIRALEDMNDVGEDGDQRFVSRDLVPLGLAVQGISDPQAPRARGDENPEGSREGSNSRLGNSRLGNSPDAMRWDGLTSQAAQRVEQAANRALAEATGRMLTKESNAARRAAKHPNSFIGWLDTWYLAHTATVADAVRPAIEMRLAISDDVIPPDDAALEFAMGHTAESQRQLLEATDCKPDELVASVEACTLKWGERERSIRKGSDHGNGM